MRIAIRPFLILALLIAILVGCNSGEDSSSSDAPGSNVFDTPGVGIGGDGDSDASDDDSDASDTDSSVDDETDSSNANTSTSSNAPASLTGIQFDIDSDPLDIKEGITYQLNVVGLYSDGSTENFNSLVQWSSSDPGVVSLLSNGMVAAVSIGSTEITASYGSFNIVVTINVEAKTVESLTILPEPQNSQEKLPVSSSYDSYFTLKATYNNGTEGILTDGVTWDCEDPEGKALINRTRSGSGKFTPYGSTSDNIFITAEYKGLTDSISVYVDDNLTLISIELKIYRGTIPGEDKYPGSLTIVEGQSASVMAIGTYSQGDKVDITHLVNWMLVNAPNGTTIEQDGTISTTTISSSLDYVDVDVDIDDFEGVNAEPVQLKIIQKELTNIVFSQVIDDVVKGNQFQISATAYYNNGTTEELNSPNLAQWEPSNDKLGVSVLPDSVVVTTQEAGESDIRVHKCKDGDAWNTCVNEDSSSYSTFEKSITIHEQTLTSLEIKTETTSSNDYYVGAINVDLADEEGVPVGMKAKLKVIGYYDEGPVSEVDLSKDGDITFSLNPESTGLSLCPEHDSEDRTDYCWVKIDNASAEGTITAEYTGDPTVNSDLTVNGTSRALVQFKVNLEGLGGLNHLDHLLVLKDQSKQLKIYKKFSNDEFLVFEDTDGVTWDFSDDGISFSSESDKITVDEDGWITGDATGDLVLKASLDGYQGTMTRLISVGVKSLSLGEWVTGTIDAQDFTDLRINIPNAGYYTFTFLSEEKENLSEIPGAIMAYMGAFSGITDYCIPSHSYPRYSVNITQAGDFDFGFYNMVSPEDLEETVFGSKYPAEMVTIVISTNRIDVKKNSIDNKQRGRS